MRIQINWDAAGIATSIACAIHCALLPLVITALPVFGINIIHNSFFEWGMIGLAFIVGSYALLHGFAKHHRSNYPFILFAAGFTFLILKQFMLHEEYLFLFLAVSLILSAHFMNFKFCRQSRRPDPEAMAG